MLPVDLGSANPKNSNAYAKPPWRVTREAWQETLHMETRAIKLDIRAIRAVVEEGCMREQLAFEEPRWKQ